MEPRRMGWAPFLIGASVALNLFFAAFLSAQAWRIAHPKDVAGAIAGAGLGSGVASEGVLRQIMSRLPPEDAKVVRQAFWTHLPALVLAERGSYQALEQLRTDIAREPYEADRVKADLQALQESRARTRPVVEDMLLEALGKMSDPGRKALSEVRLLPKR